MKKSNLWMLLFPILFSCSMEDNPTTGDALTPHTEGLQNRTLSDYNRTGVLQNALLHHFMTRHGATAVPAATVNGTLVQLVAASKDVPDFQPDLLDTFSFPSETRLAYLTDGVAGRLDEVLQHAPLTPKAKLSMSNFCHGLEYYKSERASVATVSAFIQSFEASLFADPDFKSKDLSVMLTATSVSRHALEFASTRKKRKPRDRDWDLTVGHIAVAIDLGDQSAATVAMACAAVVLHDNL